MRVSHASQPNTVGASQPTAQLQKACIDRFEKSADGKTLAVLLVGDQEKVLDVPLKSLPKGAREGDWLNVEVKGGKLVSAKIDVKETEARRKQAQELFESVFEDSQPVQQQKACIDRFEKCEDGRVQAVLLVGDEEKSMDIELSSLPKGVKEGDWLNVELQGDKLVTAKVDVKETEDRRSGIQQLFDSLFR